MIKLKIDHIEISVPEGSTILKAAEIAGIGIPTMCYKKEVPNHASCMVCAVKNSNSNEFIPSCEAKVQEGMDLICNSDEVIKFRKDALELLLSDHVGDCEAPCRFGCPLFMDIPQMNRFIAKENFSEAIKVVKEEIALPLILGYICHAPCESVCRRKEWEEAVSICHLKRMVAIEDSKNASCYHPEKLPESKKKVAIIGSGLAGLSSAYHLLKLGHQVFVFDKNEKAGGMLLDLDETVLPNAILEREVEMIQGYGADFRFNHVVSVPDNLVEYDAVILATGVINTDETLISNDHLFDIRVEKMKNAVRVVADGKDIAFKVHSFLTGTEIFNKRKQFNSRFGKLKQEEITEYLKESIPDHRIEPELGNLLGFSKEEAIHEAKRCLRCDCRKKISCKLRINSEIYNPDQHRYKFGERKIIRKNFQQDTLVYEPEKCIKCGLCIEVLKQNTELSGLAYIGRGFEMRIDTPFNKPLQDAISTSAKKCIDVCPTGALSDFLGETNLKNN